MWQFRVLLLVLGSSPLWVIAEDTTTLLEDRATTVDSSDVTIADSADDGPTTLSTTTHKTTEHYDKPPTPVSTVHSTENSTDSRVITDHPSEKVGGETKTSEKGGLETIALVGIILGIVITIGIIAGIVIAVVRKMSGRYSP
ncbi:podoplanin isoform X1 [Monodelphis domestica]|uniref:podoplanin isoform X1 n=1 Tax=Monodelphis domestica TaxID=13616 RepID=UPI0024E1CF57|nr:podoplanin isoform X1 [Monodelphis domestica]